MKTRNDFVSNSSSCSFIIKDVAKGVKALESFDVLNCPDMDNVEVTFTLKEDVFKSLNMPRLERWRDDRTHEVFCSCAASELLNLPSLALENLFDLEFQCDDYEQHAVFMLSLLYKALQLNGVEVDDEHSEIEFPDLSDSDCATARLLKYIMKSESKMP